MAIFKTEASISRRRGVPRNNRPRIIISQIMLSQGLKGENMSLIFRYLDPSLVVYSVKYSKGPTKQAVPGSSRYCGRRNNSTPESKHTQQFFKV